MSFGAGKVRHFAFINVPFVKAVAMQPHVWFHRCFHGSFFFGYDGITNGVWGLFNWGRKFFEVHDSYETPAFSSHP